MDALKRANGPSLVSSGTGSGRSADSNSPYLAEYICIYSRTREKPDDKILRIIEYLMHREKGPAGCLCVHLACACFLRMLAQQNIMI